MGFFRAPQASSTGAGTRSSSSDAANEHIDCTTAISAVIDGGDDLPPNMWPQKQRQKQKQTRPSKRRVRFLFGSGGSNPQNTNDRETVELTSVVLGDSEVSPNGIGGHDVADDDAENFSGGDNVNRMKSTPSPNSGNRSSSSPMKVAGAADDDDRSDDGGDASLNSKTSTTVVNWAQSNSTAILVAVVLFLGTATAAAFLAVGLTGALRDERAEFERSATVTVSSLDDSFEEYVDAASIIHARCRHYRQDRNWDRRDFRELYEYIIANGLEFKAMQFDPNITHDERPAAEEEARQFYAEHYPHVDYKGIRGFNTLNSTKLEPRTNQSFYFPIHYQEPIPGNEAAIDLDYYSSESRIRAVDALFEHKLPSMTDRLSLVKQAGQVSRCGDHDGPSFGVVLMHPGIELSDTLVEDVTPAPVPPERSDEPWPRDFSSIVLCVPDLLKRSTQGQQRRFSVYIHDLSHPGEEAVFMGAARLDGGGSITFLDEVALDELMSGRCGGRSDQCYQEDIPIANREWTVTVVDEEPVNVSTIVVIAIGGVIIFLASVFLAIWVRTSHQKQIKFNEMRSQAEAEKAHLVLENARRAAHTERELNDFIAHEVRNPVAAAMAATNFVKLEIARPEPLADAETIDQAREDMSIIDNALHFINDLLRNMLDMHRAASKQLKVDMAPTDLLHDVLEPVAGMLYRGRNTKVKIIVECEPQSIYVMTDALRLKQVMLNLGRNSTKFIDEGFIRLRAEEVDNNVRLFVDDSGSGIPKEKQQRLFAKFQESLDALSQGTGIGLNLCKNLVELMGGEIYLDDDYNSGIPGHPGTRFVVDLQTSSVEAPDVVAHNEGVGEAPESKADSIGTAGTHGLDDDMNSLPAELPEELSVLFIDDDFILRKLFSRSIRAVAPGWNIREAANGETALRLVEDEDFDLIFCDMYMASVEKQLLGTETVAELRNMGCTSRICGLSANDKEKEFLDAGADAFLFKPMPCDANALKETLRRVLYQESQQSTLKPSKIAQLIDPAQSTVLLPDI